MIRKALIVACSLLALASAAVWAASRYHAPAPLVERQTGSLARPQVAVYGHRLKLTMIGRYSVGRRFELADEGFSAGKVHAVRITCDRGWQERVACVLWIRHNNAWAPVQGMISDLTSLQRETEDEHRPSVSRS